VLRGRICCGSAAAVSDKSDKRQHESLLTSWLMMKEMINHTPTMPQVSNISDVYRYKMAAVGFDN